MSSVCYVLFLLVLVSQIAACSGQPAAEEMDARSAAALQRANSAFQEQEYALALALTDSILTRKPNLAHGHFMRARILSELGRFDEAEQAYTRTARLQPDYRGVWHNLGNNAFRQEQYTRAIEFYVKEMEQNPAASPMRSMARAYQEMGDVVNAEKAYQRAVEIDPQDALSHLNMGMMYENEGEFDKALHSVQKAFEIEPNDVNHRYRMGSLLFQVGRSEEAKAHLEVVVEQWPWYHSGHFLLGQVLAHMGQEEEARKRLEQAETARAAQARIEHLQNGIRSAPQDPYAHAALAAELRRAGRFDEAERSYRRALHLKPDEDGVRNNLANLFLLRGDTLQAIQEYQAILRQDSTLVNTWLNLGVVYALSKKFDEAQWAWVNALKYEPDHPAAHAYLARLTREQRQ